LWTPLHVPPRPPSYRETDGLLHSDIALGSKEYSKWEHVHKRLLHPVIHGAIFRYLLTCHMFTPRSWTFDVAPLTRPVRVFCLHLWIFFMCIYSYFGSSNPAPRPSFLNRKDFRSFHPPQTANKFTNSSPFSEHFGRRFQIGLKVSRSYFAQVIVHEIQKRVLQKSWNKARRLALSCLYYRIHESYKISENSRVKGFYPIPQYSMSRCIIISINL
jgi:hypothetical protein